MANALIPIAWRTSCVPKGFFVFGDPDFKTDEYLVKGVN
jgi:hypothetical protein